MTAALEGGEWSVARPGRTLPPGKTRYPFYRRLGGPRGRSGRAENFGISQSKIRMTNLHILIIKKVKRSRYRPGVVQRLGRDIALFFHDCGTRRG